MPEHCLAGYQLAIEQGADLIEPDLVASRDGVLFARHERGLGRSTDVASRSDWQALADCNEAGQDEWLADRFSAAQLRSLRIVQPFPGRSKEFDGQFSIPEWQEVLALAASARSDQRWLGVYPELKHPAELLQQGLDIAQLLIDSLQSAELTGAQSSVWVQCFEIEPLRRVHAACGNPCFLLLDAIDTERLKSLSQNDPWLSGVALPKSAVIGVSGDTQLVALAHAVGLQVHVWTLRDDAVLPDFSSVQDEYRALFNIGVDALFCDFPESARMARAQWATPEIASD